MAVADRVDTRQRLIDCAIDVLDRDGLAALGLREVARRAGRLAQRAVAPLPRRIPRSVHRGRGRRFRGPGSRARRRHARRGDRTARASRRERARVRDVRHRAPRRVRVDVAQGSDRLRRRRAHRGGGRGIRLVARVHHRCANGGLEPRNRCRPPRRDLLVVGTGHHPTLVAGRAPRARRTARPRRSHARWAPRPRDHALKESR